MKQKITGILRILFLIICGTVLGLNVYSANAKRLVGNKLPMPFGYGAAVVLSGSMEPEFSKGDLIIVKECDDYALRDIVVFDSGRSLTVHRIIDIDGTTVTTQGDANDVADEPIDASLIKGKVLFWLSGVGSIVEFIKTPIGTLLIIAAAILLVELPRIKKKKSDDEQKQKIIDEINKLRGQD